MSTYQLTSTDKIEITAHGLTIQAVREQLKQFDAGIPYIQIAAAATLNKGIFSLSEKHISKHITRYSASSADSVKFVPASGAATRMFKLVHQLLETLNTEQLNLSEALAKDKFKSLHVLFERLEDLPFYTIANAEWRTAMPQSRSLPENQQKINFFTFLLTDLQYDKLPKGLFPFHQYTCKTATAFEEHLYEAAAYASKEGKAQLHFTVSKAHLDLFKSTFASIQQRVEEDTDTQFEVTYSFQKKSTDTIAVNTDNSPFRTPDGKLFFRPGGHGALIQNLNKINTDIIFIKNIDNVVSQEQLPFVARYKKALAGILLQVQDEVFSLLNRLESDGLSELLKSEAQQLASTHFAFKKEFHSAEEIYAFFHRPIRICGMVKNEGEPGGGPFWVKEVNDSLSLQIVESAQIDKTNADQVDSLQKATHFNPVDIVCGVKDFRGQKFDLNDFVNRERSFITHKSQFGKELKALELPGLWNGGMAYWNTIFVEVPLQTFNPVKTVTDLLKSGHQVEIA